MKKILVFVCLLLSLSPVAWSALEPRQEVETMVNAVSSLLLRSDLSPAEKRLLLTGQVEEHLAMTTLSRRVLGSQWNEADQDQRQAFSGLFGKLLEGEYLIKLNQYLGGEVQYLKQRIKGDQAIIDSRVFIPGPDEKPLKQMTLQYLLVFEGGTWQIFDLVFDGASVTRQYRVRFTQTIRDLGFEGLLTQLNEKLASLPPLNPPPPIPPKPEVPR